MDGRWIGLLVLVACSGSDKAEDADADATDSADLPDGTTGDDDDDTVPAGDDDDDDTTGGGDTDDTDSTPVTGPTDPPTDTAPPTGGSALYAGFENDLTSFTGCLGSFYASDVADTIGLVFDANDLAGAAFLSGDDTVTNVDLAVDAWRLEVRVGTGVSVDFCSYGTSSIDAIYTPTSGSALVEIWPHNTQAEQTEGAVTFDDVVLTSPGAPPVTLVHLEIPRMFFTGL